MSDSGSEQDDDKSDRSTSNEDISNQPKPELEVENRLRKNGYATYRYLSALIKNHTLLKGHGLFSFLTFFFFDLI